MKRLLATLAAALAALAAPALAEPEVWLLPATEEAGGWSRDAAYFHLNCDTANDTSGNWGWIAPGSAHTAMWIYVEARNTGGGEKAELPCEERFGEGAMCDDELLRVLDIRLTAEAPHPVTFHDHPSVDDAGSGRNAFTVTRYGGESTHWPAVKVERDCGVGEDDMPILVRAEIVAERVEANPYGPGDFD